MKSLKIIVSTAALAAVLTFGAQTVQAATCDVSGATVTQIDTTTLGSPLNATACEYFVGNINPVFVDELNDGTFFSDKFAAGTKWTALDAVSFTADLGEKTGTWTADFGTNVMNNLVVALKASNDSALFLWKDLFQAGSKFEGGFDITDAGLRTKHGKKHGQVPDLSNFNVAGVFVGETPPPSVVPLPAAGWLLLMGIGGLGVASRRRRKAVTS